MSRNLGTLTLDLVARTAGFVQGMDKAERQSKKWKDQVSKDAKAVGTALGAGIAIGTAALTALTVSTVKAAGEISKFSALSGMTSSEFQKYASGAKAFGIEQEKLADIFKDTQDKVGDFIQTGGGALADFFENIAPAVGLTADNFKELSGKDALQLYVDSLQKANLSQSEMVFYMEAIASDSALLLPLLQDNGEAFRLLGEEAEKAGAIMDDSMIRASLELEAAAHLSGLALTGMGNNIQKALLPTLADLSGVMFELSSNTDAAREIGEVFSGVIKGVAATAFGAYSSVMLLGKSIGALAAGVMDLSWDTFTAGIDDVKQSALEYGKILDDIWSAGSDNAKKTESRVSRVADLLERQKTIQAEINSIETDTESKRKEREEREKSAAKEREKRLRDYESLVKSLRTEDEKRLDVLKEQMSVLDAMDGITEEQRQDLKDRIAGNAMSDSFSISIGGDKESLDKSAREIEVWYADQMNRLEQFRREKSELNTQWDEEELRVKQERDAKYEEIEKANNELLRQQRIEGYNTILTAMGEYYRGMEGKEAAYARVAISLSQALLDEKKRAALQSIWADTHKAAMGAYSAMADIPYVGPTLGAAAAGVVYVAGGAAAAKLTGMAHDGIDRVPEEGTWLLNKGERVLTENTSAKLDRTLDKLDNGGSVNTVVNINIDNTGETTSGGDSESRQMANAIKAVVVDELARQQRPGGILWKRQYGSV